jgi:hypothetical protein
MKYVTQGGNIESTAACANSCLQIEGLVALLP